MQFQPEPPFRRGYRPRPEAERRWLAWLLLAACAATATTTAWPWLAAHWSGAALFGPHLGPPGWKSTCGFTCLMTCLMLAVLTLVETETRSAREAVRPASALLAGIAAAVVVAEACRGPGNLRGLTAAFTVWFWAGVCGTAVVAATCGRRLLPKSR